MVGQHNWIYSLLKKQVAVLWFQYLTCSLPNDVILQTLLHSTTQTNIVLLARLEARHLRKSVPAAEEENSGFGRQGIRYLCELTPLPKIEKSKYSIVSS